MAAPMMAWDSASRPPIARPCRTRLPIRNGTLWDRPASAEPITNKVMASWTSSFLLTRSASLPQIGVDTVVASRLAVTTQVYCAWLPFRSAMIVGRALATMVVLSMAVNSAASRPTSTSRICRWVSAGAAWARS